MLHAPAPAKPAPPLLGGSVEPTPLLARPGDLAVAGTRLVGDGAVRHREAFEAAGAEVPPDADPDHVPRAHRLVGHAKAFGPAEAVEPVYLRAPDAVPSR
jgi:hypothetical protein